MRFCQTVVSLDCLPRVFLQLSGSEKSQYLQTSHLTSVPLNVTCTCCRSVSHIPFHEITTTRDKSRLKRSDEPHTGSSLERPTFYTSTWRYDPTQKFERAQRQSKQRDLAWVIFLLSRLTGLHALLRLWGGENVANAT